MAVAVSVSVWDEVLELTKSGQARYTDPLMWAMKLSSSLTTAGVSMPSTDVANLLVSHICWSNNVPHAWKLLEKALTLRIVPPMLVLALLSTRVIAKRRSYPAAYRLYMELVKRYAFSLPSMINGPNYKKTMESVDDALNFSQSFGVKSHESGVIVVGFILCIVWQLLDASLDDQKLLELTSEKKSRWLNDMDIDNPIEYKVNRTNHHESICKMNTIMAIELIGEFFKNKVTCKILYLARQNMRVDCECFIQHLQLLCAKSSALRMSKNISPEILMQLTYNESKILSKESKTSSRKRIHAVMASPKTNRSIAWLPIDLFLEDTMDGSQVAATSAVETLTGLVKALQAIDQVSWQDMFLGLWVSALRLVQRERNSSEGPVPRLDTCLCLLLSITTLAIFNIIEEEEDEKQTVKKRRQDLIYSLQHLDDYEGLLTSPMSVSSVANQAAAKAMMFLSGVTLGSGYLDAVSLNDMPLNCSGNMRNLIVEACIARNILDTSAYMWPGYVKGRTNQVPRSLSGQIPGWSSLMKGAPLTPPMVNALKSIPASSLAEIGKIYEIALNGSDDDKISAATILSGASLYRGWNIQEHTVLFITRLLSPPIPANYSDSESHLISCAPFLNVLLIGISGVDCVQIFSLHGMVPQLAGALMPICEVFGSCPQNVSWSLPNGEEITPHALFSNAFTHLLKLWRFDKPPTEPLNGQRIPLGSHLTPELLLLIRNCQLSGKNSHQNGFKSNRLSRLSSSSSIDPIFMDNFPKLKQWYRQHLSCIASPFSGLVPGPLHQLADGLLNMMFKKINRGGQTISGNSNNSSGSGIDDSLLHLSLPAWDILEAVPFVLDASLTAVSHGRLSPRELATGLKDLADFLPASLAAIVSYFSAEVTRGLWKPATMNGSDWPSPAANLTMVEEQIKKILAGTGVDVPSLSSKGNSPAVIPLPLAALVSLTITYKLDGETDRFLNLVGPSVSNLATSCPWPCMAITAALWAQKVKRWSDFVVFSASRGVFYHNSDALVQLLRVCFTTTLGQNCSSVTNHGGVGPLLGHGFGSHFSGGITPVAPGKLYLRVHRAVRNVMFMTEEIVTLLMQSVKDIANGGLSKENLDKLKKTKHNMKYGQVSIASAMTRVKLAASLSASLVWITGGLNLVQSLIRETLPLWFISVHGWSDRESGGMVSMLEGYALAYFAVLSGMFVWGLDGKLPESKCRAKVLEAHLEFLGSGLDGKISLGCNKSTWRAYVSGFISLIVGCTPKWMEEVDVQVLKRVSKGLKKWNEEELALALLGVSGIGAMGAAAEMIIQTGI